MPRPPAIKPTPASSARRITPGLPLDRTTWRWVSSRGSSATAAKCSGGTRRSVPTTSRPSARLYTTLVPSLSNSACVVVLRSRVRITSAELTRDLMTSLPSSVTR